MYKVIYTLLCLFFYLSSIGQDLRVGQHKAPITKRVIINNEAAAIDWIYPQVDLLPNAEKKVNEPSIGISFKIRANFDIRPENLIILVNGKDCECKSGEIDINTSNKRNVVVTKTIELSETLNDRSIIRIGVKGKSGAVFYAEKDLNVVCSPDKVNLYLLSIGPDFPDLRYTEQDAEDFANIFKNQNKLFKSINKTVLLGEEAKTTPVKSAIGSYRGLYNIGDITDKDLLIIFISAHGFILNGTDFRIQCSDYQSINPDLTSISYKEDIIERLKNVKCKKLIFIDACHSGAAKMGSEGGKVSEEKVSQALIDIMSTQSGVTTITSSQGEQKSYEDAIWKNGAFTEAIIEGFEGGADANNDGIIRVPELFKYIEKQVPNLVKKQKRQKQTPVMNTNELGNLPIFIR